MATQIVIFPGDQIVVDNTSIINWEDKGNAMPALPNTVHAVVWNTMGPNEIQSKDPSTGNMTGNTALSSTSDAVGSTTIAALLTWAETRQLQIDEAYTTYNVAVADDETNGTNNTEGKTWVDYDPNYS
jgi:hypothetical protein